MSYVQISFDTFIIHVHIDVHTYIYIHIYAYIEIYIYIHIYIYIYIYIYIVLISHLKLLHVRCTNEKRKTDLVYRFCYVYICLF